MNRENTESLNTDNNYIDRLVFVLFGLFVSGYLLQIVSPLRINTDSYRLLSMAVSAFHGQGYLVDGQPDQFPIGYPFLIKSLLQADIASSMSVLAINLLGIFLGLVVFYKWCNPIYGRRVALLGTTLTLSSWIMVKHVTLPLSEMVYFGVSLFSLRFIGLFLRSDGAQKWLFFIAATILAYIAFLCRTVGVVMIPLLAISVIFHKDIFRCISNYVAQNSTQRLLVLLSISLAALLGVLAFLFMVSQTQWFESQFLRDGSYFQKLLYRIERDGILAFYFENIRFRLLEFGEVFSNIPASKIPQFISIQYAIGVVGWGMILHGCWLLIRERQLLFLPLYFLTYSALMITWPYYDPRFWLPLLPVLILLVFRSIKFLSKRWQAIHLISTSYAMVFMFLGLIALIYSSRISLSGKEFSEWFGNGSSRYTYRYAFQNGKNIDTSKVDTGQVRLLKIFEPMARDSTLQLNKEHSLPANSYHSE